MQGPNELSNNSLLSLDNLGEADRALVCSTYRNDNGSIIINDHGNWFLPNGSRIGSTANDFQTLHVNNLEYQAIELNRVHNSTLPTGVYHCEMMDKENTIHSLFVGIYPENEGI